MSENEKASALTPLDSYEQWIFKLLQNCELFSTYCDAFRIATGLPLRFMRADEEWCLREHRQNQSPFCEKLFECRVACQECVSVNHRLMKQAEVEGPTTCGCFSGLCATAVPIRLGATTIGFLKTGQVFQRQPKEADFTRFIEKLDMSHLSFKEVQSLRDTYLQTQQIDPDRYRSMVALLDSFANQLSQHAEEVAISDEGKEPADIQRARRYIHAHLDEALPLGTVAAIAGLSESHFCRVFKSITNLTLTDYVTRARIQWACKELLRPSTRISEIAFQVGFQSLSQFNRSFTKIHHCSPSAWRDQKLSQLSA